MTHSNKASLCTVGLALGLLAPTLGCFNLGNPCKTNDNCPVPEQCVVQLGTTTATCVHPTALVPAPAVCTEDSQCASGTCYEGYCYTESLVDACFDSDSLCPLSYCDFNGTCAPSDNGETVLRGEGADFSIVVRDSNDIAALQAVDVIAGTLYIGTNSNDQTFNVGVERIELPNLTKVTQGIVVRNQTTLRELSLPNLIQVGYDGVTVENNPSLETLSMPSFVRAAGTTVGGFISISDNFALATVDFTAFAEAVGAVIFLGADDEADPQPTVTFRMPNLTSVDTTFLLFGTNATFDTLTLGPLQGVANLTLADIDADLSPFLGSLVSVSEDLSLSGLSGTTILRLTNLGSVGALEIDDTLAEGIELPALTTATSLSIDGNTLLTGLQAPALTTCPTVEVIDNPLLDVCLAKAIADGASAGTVDLDGNMGDPGSCP